MRVAGWRGCGRWSVLGGFLCWFDVGEGVLGVVLGAGVAGVANGVSVRFWVFPLVRPLWRPVWVLVAVLVWVLQFLVLGLGVIGWVLLGVGARHSWLRAWSVHLCVLAVFLAALQLPWRGVAGLLFFGFSCVACVCGGGGARALMSGVRL